MTNASRVSSQQNLYDDSLKKSIFNYVNDVNVSHFWYLQWKHVMWLWIAQRKQIDSFLFVLPDEILTYIMSQLPQQTKIKWINPKLPHIVPIRCSHGEPFHLISALLCMMILTVHCSLNWWRCTNLTGTILLHHSSVTVSN